MVKINKITKKEFATWLETNNERIIYKVRNPDNDKYCNLCPLAVYIQELDPTYKGVLVTLKEVWSADFKTIWLLPKWTDEFIQNFDKIAGRDTLYGSFNRKSMRGKEILKVLNKTHKSLM